MKPVASTLLAIFAVASLGCASAEALQKKTERKKYEVTHTTAEWRKLLPPPVFRVLRQAFTEQPWSGKLLDVHEKGVFVCAGCGQKLFKSETKFDSGTGWPSFWDPITKASVDEVEDLSDGMDRTEVKCAKCGGHLGHVFNDGPAPTGLRFCMNSLAMKFVPDVPPKK